MTKSTTDGTRSSETVLVDLQTQKSEKVKHKIPHAYRQYTFLSLPLTIHVRLLGRTFVGQKFHRGRHFRTTATTEEPRFTILCVSKRTPGL